MNDVGQFFTIGISGYALTSDEEQFIEKENIGGVILFAHNYESPAQIAELVNSIQSLRSEYPLFISVDHEGGRVMRFKQNFTHFPAMLDLASLNSPKLCYEAHKIMAEELASCGINMSFSPCCDVLYNTDNKVIGDRSFGGSIDKVDKFVSAAIRGLQTSNVISVAKHFPGHGGTTKDSHYDLPLVKTSMKDLLSKEIPTFQRAAKSRVEMVLMAHLLVDAIDEELPTSLSPRAYDLLRSELKFDRVVVTDDMEMKAITDRYTIEESCFMALQAGADQLVIRSFENSVKSFQHVKKKIASKEMSSEALTEKMQRIYTCKEKYLKEYRPIYIPSISQVIGKDSHQVFLSEIKKKIEEHQQN